MEETRIISTLDGEFLLPILNNLYQLVGASTTDEFVEIYSKDYFLTHPVSSTSAKDIVKECIRDQIIYDSERIQDFANVYKYFKLCTKIPENSTLISFCYFFVCYEIIVKNPHFHKEKVLVFVPKFAPCCV